MRKLDYEILVKMLEVSPFCVGGVPVVLDATREKKKLAPKEFVDGMRTGRYSLTFGGRIVENRGVGMNPVDADIALAYYTHHTYWQHHGSRPSVYAAANWGSLAAGAEGSSGTPVANPYRGFSLRKLTDDQVGESLDVIFAGGVRGGAFPEMFAVDSVPEEFLPGKAQSSVLSLAGKQYRVTLEEV